MFKSIGLSFCNQITGKPFSRAQVLALLEKAGDISHKVIVFVPALHEAITMTAQMNRAVLKDSQSELAKLTPGKFEFNFDRSIASGVRDGFDVDIAIGDDYALAVNEYHKLPTTVDGKTIARHSMSTKVFLSVIDHIYDYVAEYDSVSKIPADDQAEADFAEGQIADKAIAAASYAAGHAELNSISRCARYVRKALQHAGFRFTQQASAYQYHTTGQMEKMGYTELSGGKYDHLVGDVAIFDRTAKHKHGHICIFTTKGWVSDFFQPHMNPYRNKKSAGKLHYYRCFKKGGAPRGRATTTITTTYKKASKVHLKDITFDKDKLTEIAKRRSKSMSLTQFTTLLQDLHDATNIPLGVLSKVAHFENGYPNTPAKLLKSDSYEVSRSFRGPFQLGAPHWVDSKGFIKAELGVTVPSNRSHASIAAQGVAMILYVYRYAKSYSTLGRLELEPETFYLLHNAGPGGLLAIVSKNKVPQWLVDNSAAQSPEVKRVIARYNPQLGRRIQI